jgi:lipopolysaccharide transport system ATP-binding protein
MEEISRLEGRTVLFVSHNMGVITSLCPRTIWIENGSVREQGPTRSLVSRYLTQYSPNQDAIVSLAHFQRPHIIVDDRLRIESIEWLCDLPLKNGQPFRAQINFRVRAPVSDVSIGIGFSSQDGRRLLSYETDFQDGFRQSIANPGTYFVEVQVGDLPLAPDVYAFDIGSRSADFHPLDYLAGSFQIEVIAGPRTPGTIVRKDAGVRLPSEWLWKPV